MKRLFILALVAGLLCGCIEKMDPFLFSIMEMGFVQDGSTILGDDGNSYQLKVRPTGDENWTTGARIIASMKISSKLSETSYEVSDYEYTYPFSKPVVELDASDIPDSLGTAGINVANVWYSGGHLNMLNQIYYDENQGGHTINVIVDSKRDPAADTLKVWVRHLAAGKIADASARSTYTFYSSFPIKDYMPAKDSVVLSVNYYWDMENKVLNGKVGIK